MASKYTPSINIIRDLNEDIAYFPTQNAQRVAEQIETSFTAGIRVFNIIGSYGTGKSSFLWALAQTLRGKKHFFEPRCIPSVAYTDPEIAWVGLTEMEAKEKNIAYEVTTFDMKGQDRALTEESAYGVVKVLTVPGKDKILGVTIVGLHAGDILAEYVLAMKYNLGLNKILGTIHVYPTLAEANKSVAGNWRRNHVSPFALKFAEAFNNFRRS